MLSTAVEFPARNVGARNTGAASSASVNLMNQVSTPQETPAVPRRRRRRRFARAVAKPFKVAAKPFKYVGKKVGRGARRLFRRGRSRRRY